MQKLISAFLLFLFLIALNKNAFADTLLCKFKTEAVSAIKSLVVDEDVLIINSRMEIPLEKSRVRCGNFGRQVRLDGMDQRFQVVLKSCSTEAKLEGHIIDARAQEIAEVVCDNY